MNRTMGRLSLVLRPIGTPLAGAEAAMATRGTSQVPALTHLAVSGYRSLRS
jgi:hypothetical protein